ncbi:acyl-CoA N-acyltransferase [Neohortaea acidophila]|uniref:Acyl-CoA N-acyltransferase n=1 Tax=Neohortaea acidophila TaxID=245834 RepID=A0A6A6Q1J0_9PEZI|nr:acyl-CoA N-acyltransferase [Neohortaea acidophila]KAF2485856.1 acyl-CoA N-acyltransferase [Neohortaea acidophila]
MEKEDEDYLFTLAQDADSYLNSWNSLPTPPGTAQAKSMYEEMSKALLNAVVCLPASTKPEADGTTALAKPTPIGTVILGSRDAMRANNRAGFLGITIEDQYQGQGYGSEVINWVLDFGFRYMNLHRVELQTFGSNLGAIRLYERLGFVHEGRRRETTFREGEYVDSVVMGILEGEWRRSRGIS